MAGLDLPGVHVLHTMDDSFLVHDRVVSGKLRDVAIVGSGYIGLEIADALTHRGLRVTLFGRAETVLPIVDRPLGLAIADEPRRNGVEVHAGVAVQGIDRGGHRRPTARGAGVRTTADLVVVAAGVQPNTTLAAAAGVETGIKGAIRVDRRMATNVPDVYAPATASKPGIGCGSPRRTCHSGPPATNRGGWPARTPLAVNTSSKAASAPRSSRSSIWRSHEPGLREQEARQAGFDPLTAETQAWDHKAYYPGAHQLCLRLTGDRQTGRLLGGQILGPWQAEVAKRIDGEPTGDAEASPVRRNEAAARPANP